MSRGKLLDVIAGARPNFMKIAPIVKQLEKRQGYEGSLRYRLIHTGQHFDVTMSGAFFQQLGIPEPDVNLGVGAGSQSTQTAGIMCGYEEILLRERPHACLVVGDVTSTMACAITAQKLGVPVAHVEGGIRSGDWTMPEEINRLVTDAITNWFFTTSAYANENLRHSGVSEERIFFVGNTMIDTLMSNLSKLSPPTFWKKIRLVEREYFVVTLHRPSNVDSLDHLFAVLDAIASGARGSPIVFPVHPRTAGTLAGSRALPGNLHVVDPQPYLEFNYLVKNSKAVITDSGGVTEEATVLGVPCLTMRDNTERPETVEVGTNELVGSNADRLREYMDKLFDGEWKRGSIPEMWDGRAAERIVSALETLLSPSYDLQ